MEAVFGKKQLTVTLLLFLWVCSWTTPAVNGWGQIGHELIANVAWRLLPTTTQTKVDSILKKSRVVVDKEYNNNNNDNNNNNKTDTCGALASRDGSISSDNNDCVDCSSLGCIANWADQIRYRKEYHWSAVLHYIDIRDDLIPGGCPVHNIDSRDDVIEDPCLRRQNKLQQQQQQQQVCAFDYHRDCPKDACVAGSIVNYTRQLEEGKKDDYYSDSDVAASGQSSASSSGAMDGLRFVTHFVGDIHQPLHCGRGSDKGGNTLTVSIHTAAGTIARTNEVEAMDRFDLPLPLDDDDDEERIMVTNVNGTAHGTNHHKLNLHAVWDTSIIEQELHQTFRGHRVDYEDHLYSFIVDQYGNNRQQWDDWLACPDGGDPDCTSLWAEEALELALEWSYRNTDGTEIKEGTVLSQSYMTTRMPIVDYQLAVAAVRLAATLHRALHRQEGPDATLRPAETL